MNVILGVVLLLVGAVAGAYCHKPLAKLRDKLVAKVKAKLSGK